VATDFHNPISKAVRPEDTVETLSEYRRSQGRGKEEYARMVTAFDDLITDFFEYGWGQSFHFAPMNVGESFEESIAGYQHFLGEAIGLRPGMKVLDVGCGVGGPQRSLARKFGVSIVGLNINEYQLGKCSAYNSKAGLDHLCSILYGDFLNIPAEDGSFDAAYHVEAISHAPDKAAVYAEIFRVLRPGAVFAGYDWCMTPLYDGGDPVHRELKQGIEYGNALPEIASFTEVAESLRAAGFEGIETHDRALDADPGTPWYRPLEGRALTLRGLPRTPLGRRITSAALRVLETGRAVPRGSFAVHEVLNVAADSLTAAGRLGIFTPMYFHKARKPG
jgi:sterol 24-C-methyltransferase